MTLLDACITSLVLLLLFWQPENISEETRKVFSFIAALPFGVCLWAAFQIFGRLWG